MSDTQKLQLNIETVIGDSGLDNESIYGVLDNLCSKYEDDLCNENEDENEDEDDDNEEDGELDEFNEEDRKVYFNHIIALMDKDKILHQMIFAELNKKEV